eukprot:m.170384 g.170384  ORF g.170384 m.170384 type:complete len:892 (+) comp17827_c0_seq2:442-3117(+)
MVELQLQRRLSELGNPELTCPADEEQRSELAAYAKVFADGINTSATQGISQRRRRGQRDYESIPMSALGDAEDSDHEYEGDDGGGGPIDGDDDTEAMLLRENPFPPNAGWLARGGWAMRQGCLRVGAFVGVDWAALAALGMCTALIGFLLDDAVTYLLSLRQRIGQHTSVPFFVLWVLYMQAGVFVAVCITRYVAPNAEGSGIPQMNTVLKGFSSHNYLSGRTFFAKLTGLVFAEGSGLPIGKEGPFVHLASIVAEMMGRHVPMFRGIFANESRRLELLAAACAVGVASNFAAPIGGVLFSIEVTATYFAVRNYWRGFFASVMGAFVFRLLAVVVSNERTITSLFTTTFNEYPFDLEEMIAFSAVGIACGLAGALFVYLHRLIVEQKALLSQPGGMLESLKYHPTLYPMACAGVIAVFTFPGFVGKFMGMSQTMEINHLFASQPLECVDEWATTNIFFSLSVFLFFKFFMTAFAIGLPLPAGVFVPVFVAGGAFGRIVGEAMAVWFPQGFRIDKAGSLEFQNATDICAADYPHKIAAGGYAVVGAAALAGSVTQSISTSVIVFELTGQIQHILPVMIAVLLSISICQKLSPSLYDSIIQLKGMPYLPDLRKGSGYKLLVSDIMRQDVFYVALNSTYARIAELLTSAKFRSFPLVDSPETQVLVGSISRSELKRMLSMQLNRTDIDVQPTAAPDPPASSSHSQGEPPTPSGNAGEMGSDGAALWQAKDENSASVTVEPMSEDERRRSVLLQETANFKHARVDPSPFQLVEHTSLYKVHTLFSLLGLSLAYVTHVGRLVGVVGLKEVRAAVDSAAGRRAFERDGRRHPASAIRFALHQPGPHPNNDDEGDEGDEGGGAVTIGSVGQGDDRTTGGATASGEGGASSERTTGAPE